MATIAIIVVLFIASAAGLVGSLKSAIAGNSRGVQLGLLIGIAAMLIAVGVILYSSYWQRPLNTLELLIFVAAIGVTSWLAFRKTDLPESQ